MKEKQFIDEAWINIESGRGGDGLATFLKGKGMAYGGPAGGNGGDGGSIIFIGESGENTLLDFMSNRVFKAGKGGVGGANNKTGGNGEDLIIKVPLGTQFFQEDGKYLFEIIKHGQQFIPLRGGKGGRGNTSFKNSKNTTPLLYEAGELGHKLRIKLNLKVLADVGLLGFPNAGKSTLISVISNAKPKIADYPFTTLVPKLGLVKHNDFKFVVSDLPGLIEGASENKGMGIQFLKHLERTSIIIHLIDGNEEDILNRYEILRKELNNYSSDLFSKDEIIVISKVDLIDETKIEEIKETFKNHEVFFISSLTRENLEVLLTNITDKLKEFKTQEEVESEFQIYEFFQEQDNDKLAWSTERVQDDEWLISGKYTEYWGNRIPMTNQENFWRLYKKLEAKGVIKELIEKGLKEGDLIKIANSKFELQYFED